jgi:hypothetical protein
MTAKQAPGPGPIRTRNWTRIATKHLKDKQVILHTDGARAYKIKVPGIMHDNVVHKKKLMRINGKATWVKPHYTRVYVHKLPVGQKVKVKAGTQIIDRFWGTLRQGLKNISRQPGSARKACWKPQVPCCNASSSSRMTTRSRGQKTFAAAASHFAAYAACTVFLLALVCILHCQTCV